MPFSLKTSAAATDIARIAGWAFAVSCKSSAGPSKHNLEKGKTQRLVGRLEGSPRARKLLRQLAAHAGMLRTLTGEEESDFLEPCCQESGFEVRRPNGNAFCQLSALSNELDQVCSLIADGCRLTA